MFFQYVALFLHHFNAVINCFVDVMSQVEIKEVVLPDKGVLRLVVLCIHRLFAFFCHFYTLLKSFFNQLKVLLEHVNRRESLVQKQVEIRVLAYNSFHFVYRLLKLSD